MSTGPQNLIFRALADNLDDLQLPASDLARAADVSVTTVRNHLRVMTRRGWVVPVARTMPRLWRLTDQGRSVAMNRGMILQDRWAGR